MKIILALAVLLLLGLPGMASAHGAGSGGHAHVSETQARGETSIIPIAGVVAAAAGLAAVQFYKARKRDPKR